MTGASAVGLMITLEDVLEIVRVEKRGQQQGVAVRIIESSLGNPAAKRAVAGNA